MYMYREWLDFGLYHLFRFLRFVFMLFGDFFLNKLVQIDEMYSKMNIKYIFDYDKQGMLINL